jgi:hypothetical protein
MLLPGVSCQDSALLPSKATQEVSVNPGLLVADPEYFSSLKD